MELEILPFKESDIDKVYAIQLAAFKPLYEKYRDDSTSPYKESKETTLGKYKREGTQGYVFRLDGEIAGAVRVAVKDGVGRISALCVLPKCQGRGVAQKALLEIEKLYPGVEKWSLDTIQQEAGNCHLYEKLGYKAYGEKQQINDRMTLVFYEKFTSRKEHGQPSCK